MAVPLTFEEYAALTTLRAVVRTLRRVALKGDNFRSPLLRRLVASALGVLEECVTEIESYDPGMQESVVVGDDHDVRYAIPDVQKVAEQDAKAGKARMPFTGFTVAMCTATKTYGEDRRCGRRAGYGPNGTLCPAHARKLERSMA